jgi:hypothetical protein
MGCQTYSLTGPMSQWQHLLVLCHILNCYHRGGNSKCVCCHELPSQWQRHVVGVPSVMCGLQIDGMKNRVLMKRFNVLGFPSIYLLKDGSTWQYNGVRTVADVS